MTHLSRDDVAKLATMSSLQLQDDEIEPLRADIERILDYIQQLDELDTSGVKPTYQVNQLQNVWRDDVPTPSLAGEALLQLAPEQIDQQIKVPKVL